MSRIHEALKKAELERGEAPKAPVAGRPEPALADELMAPLAPAAAEPLRTRASEIVGAAFEPLTLDALRQQHPASEWRPNSRAVLFADPAGALHPSGAEEFRTLRSRLYHIREKQPLQTVLVTSALPSEGKTFVTLNLARAIARQQQRSVLVIDADLRISRVHEGVGASPAPGLSDYLKGEVDALEIIQRGPEDNFFIIAGGSPNPNPVELLGTGRLRALINRFTPVFDWIILDSPPAVFLSDASLLAKVCDGVLVVVQSGVTPFDTAQKACREFAENQLVGVVLNRVPSGSSYGYEYYYGQSHGAGQQSAKNGKSRH
ncbi:MAG TPA: CpsD/CapB family tyrosine-protein kinase [Terriglobia bacterium]